MPIRLNMTKDPREREEVDDAFNGFRARHGALRERRAHERGFGCR
jgi:hypothetical protein